MSVIQYTPQAEEDLKRFGWKRAFLLRDEIRALLDDPVRLFSGEPVPEVRGQRLVPLAGGYLAILRIERERMIVEGVITDEEAATAAASLGPDE